MTKYEKCSVATLRIALGALFTYAGLSKIIDPAWSAAGYLTSAKTFPGLFAWFAAPQNIDWVNILNEWGLLVIGASLILGLGTRIAAVAGSVLMALYYLPILDFPYAGTHSFIVDEHLMYIAVFGALFAFDGGRYWGLDSFLVKWAMKRGMNK